MRLLWLNLAVDDDDPALGFSNSWIRCAAERVEHIDVVTMTANRYDLPGNVRVFSLGKELGYTEPRRALEFYRIVGGLIARHQYDACFAHMAAIFAVMAWPLLRIRGVPIVLWYAHRKLPLSARLAARLSERVVASSRSGSTLRTPKLRVIGQGIDVTRFRPSDAPEKPERPFSILTVGRLSPVKKVEAFIDALALVRASRPYLDFRASIVGAPATASDAAYVRRLEDAVRASGLSGLVQFCGSVSFPDVDRVYRDADCFVNCCDTGAVDKAMLEAMSSGLPVVTSNPVFHEILGPALAARCVTISNHADELSRRMIQIADMPPDTRHRLGEHLREVVIRDHSLPRLISMLLDELACLTRRAGTS